MWNDGDKLKHYDLTVDEWWEVDLWISQTIEISKGAMVGK